MNAADANLVLREGRDHDRGLERPPAGPEHRPPHGDPVGLRRRRARHDGLGGERELTVRGEADVFVEGSRDRSRRAGALRGGLRDLLLDAVKGQTGPGLSVGHTGTCGTSTGILIYRLVFSHPPGDFFRTVGAVLLNNFQTFKIDTVSREGQWH